MDSYNQLWRLENIQIAGHVDKVNDRDISDTMMQLL